MLESLATGKADAAVGMTHRWLKPLEAGFDVKIVSSHGGCVRLVGVKEAGITNDDLLCRTDTAPRLAAAAQPADGLGALIRRMAAEPVRLVKGGFVH